MMRMKSMIALTALLLGLGYATWYWVTQQTPIEEARLDGKRVTFWLQEMATDVHADREQIRDQLVALGKPAIPSLLAALEAHPTSFERKLQTSAFVVNNLPSVANWLQRYPWGASWMAAYTLAAMPPDPRIRDALIRELHHAKHQLEDSNIGFYAAVALGSVYTNDWAVVLPELRAALRVPHDNIRAAAARALPSFGTNGLAALPDLVRLLGDNDIDVVAHSAGALGKFGPAASSALPTLTPLTTNATALVRRSAAVAIWRIKSGSDFPTEILLGCMNCSSTQERVFAAEELTRLNPSKAAFAVDTYVRILNSPPDFMFGQTNHSYRIRSARNLGGLGRVAESALPTLARVAESDENSVVRQEAKSALQQIAQAGSKLTP